MPNKLDLVINANFRPEGRKAINTGEVGFSYDPGNKKFVHNIQTIANAAEEAIDVGDVGTVGLIIITNTSSTNYVEIGLTGSYSIKLLPGQTCAFQPAGTLYALANTADVDIETYVFPEA